jgi:ankyrin repeat protein
MPSRSLPPRPNLTQLKIQANELRRAHRERNRSAAARIAAHHPRMKGVTLEAVFNTSLALADVQLVVAREHGFDNWARLKHHVETAGRIARFKPHPRFDDAVAALDAGDIEQLRRSILSEPELIQARTNLDPPYHYFTGATFLHHVAGNPDRGRLSGELGPLPKNIVEIARLLLDSGADVNATTLGPNGGTTMELLCTSKQASDANVSGPLIELLLERGASLDLKDPAALDAPLANHAPRAAEKMIELGASIDVLAAAALGRMDLLRRAFDAQGKLRSRPRRSRKTMSERDAIGLAMLFAYVRGQMDAVDFLLEKDGNWNMIGVNNGTALHRAASSGDLAMVERLVAKGADVNDRNNPFTGTPMGWASHNQQHSVVEWLQEHCPIDLHDAVAFDLKDHAEARLREDPASINRLMDDSQLSWSTPLHRAAAVGREVMAKLLLEKGADPNILAGNGLTALDLAERAHAQVVAELITQHGGKHAADLEESAPATD